MATFPTLTEGSLTILAGLPIVERRENSVLRSKFEGGYVQTRPRFTRARRVWQITYNQLSSANKILIDNFIDTVLGGADSFTWTNPQNSTSYTVRFKDNPTFSYTSYNRWNVNFTLEQV